MILKMCVICDKEFETSGSKNTCSDKCSLERRRQTQRNYILKNEGLKQKTKKEDVISKCSTCGKEFIKTRGNIFCSKECREKKKYEPPVRELQINTIEESMKFHRYGTVLNMLTEYDSINLSNLKNNIVEIMKQNNINRPTLAKELNISLNSLTSLLNSARDLKMPFELVVKICVLFSIGIEDLAKDNIQIEDKKPRADKKWTDELKQQLINDYESINEDFSMNNLIAKYKIGERSIHMMYKKFKGEWNI